MTSASSRAPRLPAVVERLRLPLYDKAQRRLRERWGFDLNSADSPQRAEQLLTQSPDDSDCLLLAAAVRSSRGDDAGALAAARRAVHVDPGSARAHTTLATLLAHTGDAGRAVTHAQRAAELDDSDPTVIFNRAMARWAAGERSSAREDLHRTAEMLGVPQGRWWQRWPH